MYNVVVVDDETWICKLIRKIVDWESLGFCIIANESDGLAALKRIKEQKPDLVITDIRMPGLDGIGLIRAVRELKQDVEFVIISGYSDFEYARSALTFDAFAYILKPLDKNEFEDILRQVKERIDSKRTIKSKLETSETVMLENNMRQIIDKIKKDVSVQELNKLYGTKFGGGCFYAVILKWDAVSREKKEHGEDGSFQKFLTDIKEKHAAGFNEMIFFPEKINDQDVAIVNTAKADDRKVKDVMKEVMKAFAGSDLARSCHLTICIGSRVERLSEIDASYAAAADALKARVYLGVDRIIDAKEEACRIADEKNVIDIRVKKRLAVLFDVLAIEEASSEISLILLEMGSRCEQNLVIFHLAAYEIIDLLFDSMRRKGIAAKNGLSRQKAMQRVDSLMSKNEIEAFVCKLLKEFGSVYADEKQGGGEKLIIEIKKFISENYMADINLDDVAKRVCLSPTYVSEVFKRKTGENFSEFLIDYRIDIAKNVLKDIRYKVVDISLMVGYRDSKYFSRLFKKKVGVNPSDYRKMYL